MEESDASGSSLDGGSGPAEVTVGGRLAADAVNSQFRRTNMAHPTNMDDWHNFSVLCCLCFDIYCGWLITMSWMDQLYAGALGTVRRQVVQGVVYLAEVEETMRNSERDVTRGGLHPAVEQYHRVFNKAIDECWHLRYNQFLNYDANLSDEE